MNGRAWRRGSDRSFMAGGERDVQSASLKAFDQSPRLVVTPRLPADPAMAVTGQTWGTSMTTTTTRAAGALPAYPSH
jgi:hypothetical protein